MACRKAWGCSTAIPLALNKTMDSWIVEVLELGENYNYNITLRWLGDFKPSKMLQDSFLLFLQLFLLFFKKISHISLVLQLQFKLQFPCITELLCQPWELAKEILFWLFPSQRSDTTALRWQKFSKFLFFSVNDATMHYK